MVKHQVVSGFFGDTMNIFDSQKSRHAQNYNMEYPFAKSNKQCLLPVLYFALQLGFFRGKTCIKSMYLCLIKLFYSEDTE